MHSQVLGKPVRRRSLLAGIAGLSAASGLTLASSACGLRAPWLSRRMPRIGYGSYGPRETHEEVNIGPFLEGLRELGYVEGETISIDWRFTVGDGNEEFKRVAAELSQQPLDLIVSANSVGLTQELKRATTTTPVVAFLLLPVESGFVTTLARPGGNITGVTADIPGGEAKYVELLREVVPDLHQVVLLMDNRPSVQLGGSARWDLFRTAAESVGIRAARVDVASPDDVEAAFETPAMREAQAFSSAANGPLQTVASRVAELAIQHHLASMNRQREWAAMGFLMSYGPREAAISRRLATYVDKILKGASPAELPVEQPTVFDLAVNVKTLQALGLTIPASLQSLVTDWIQ